MQIIVAMDRGRPWAAGLSASRGCGLGEGGTAVWLGKRFGASGPGPDPCEGVDRCALSGGVRNYQ